MWEHQRSLEDIRRLFTLRYCRSQLQPQHNNNNNSSNHYGGAGWCVCVLVDPVNFSPNDPQKLSIRVEHYHT